MEGEIEKNSQEDFVSRFDALALEAKAYGLTTAFVTVADDRLSDDATLHSGFRGNYYAAMGGMRAYIHGLEHRRQLDGS